MSHLLQVIYQALLLAATLCFTLAVSNKSQNVSQNCSTMVTLSEELSTDCNSSNWMSETCNNFNDVLSIISNNDSVDCVEIRLMPGRYVLTEMHLIKTNIVIRGESGVFVTFNFSDEYLKSVNHSSGKPLYVLSFSDAKYVELSFIAFSSSPGLIGADSILSVRVVGCTFE